MKREEIKEIIREIIMEYGKETWATSDKKPEQYNKCVACGRSKKPGPFNFCPDCWDKIKQNAMKALKEAFGMAHDTVNPVEEPTINKSTIK
jgi:hypothetical protein